AGCFLDPADQVRAAETREIADGIDSAIAPAAAVPESQAVGRVQNTPKMQKMPIAASVSTPVRGDVIHHVRRCDDTALPRSILPAPVTRSLKIDQYDDPGEILSEAFGT